MTSYRLHYFPESGNSYKLALMLILCGQTFEPIWTDFAGGVTRTPDWRRKINAMGEIPVLEEDNRILTQTGSILLHLSRRYRCLDGPEHDQFEILRWLFWDNQKLSGYMAAYRYRRAFTASPDTRVLAFLRDRLDDFLGILEHELERRPFVVGTTATVADISMCGYLMFPSDEAGYDFSATHPAIAGWLARIQAIPGWRAPYEALPGARLPRYHDVD